MKQFLYRVGRWLMHRNYIKGVDAVEHDLRLEVQELRQELAMLRLDAIIKQFK